MAKKIKIAEIEPTANAANGFGGYLMDDSVALMDDATVKMSDDDTESSVKPLSGNIVRN